MKKLMMNEKGMTAVEVLVCFILVVVITVSMYTTVSTYKNKQQIESYKEQIYTYKNLLSKDINDDIVKTGLINAEITEFNTTGNEATGLNTYSANLYLRDGKGYVYSDRCRYDSSHEVKIYIFCRVRQFLTNRLQRCFLIARTETKS